MRAGVDEPCMCVCARRELGSGARERGRAGETRARGGGWGPRGRRVASRRYKVHSEKQEWDQQYYILSRFGYI